MTELTEQSPELEVGPPMRRSRAKAAMNWIVVIAISTGLCGMVVLQDRLGSLSEFERLVVPLTAATVLSLAGWIITALAIWVVAALLCGITRARRRKNGLIGAGRRQPWQFSLRSLWVVMTLCAVMCSLLKTLPTVLAVYVVFCSLWFIITIVSIGLLTVVIDNLITLIERIALRLGWLRPSSRENGQDHGEERP